MNAICQEMTELTCNTVRGKYLFSTCWYYILVGFVTHFQASYKMLTFSIKSSEAFLCAYTEPLD